MCMLSDLQLIIRNPVEFKAGREALPVLMSPSPYLFNFVVYKGNIKSRGISKVSSCDYHYWLLQLSKFQNYINITIFIFPFFSLKHIQYFYVFSLFPFQLFILFYICNLQNFLSDNTYLSNLLLLNTDSVKSWLY